MIADHMSSRVWVYDGEDRKVEIWLRQAEKERDDAVEALESLEAAILESLPYRYDDGTDDEADPGECLDYAAEEIAKLRREVSRIQKMLDVCCVVHEHNVKLVSERDEARAILRKREPTREEAEDGETAPGRTHVKSGDWTGRVCFGCAVWVWRGRTMCDACEAKEQQT
jgi:hypothetical protein